MTPSRCSPVPCRTSVEHYWMCIPVTFCCSPLGWMSQGQFGASTEIITVTRPVRSQRYHDYDEVVMSARVFRAD